MSGKVTTGLYHGEYEWQPHMKIRWEKELRKAVRVILEDGQPRSTRMIYDELLERFKFSKNFRLTHPRVLRAASLVATHKEKGPGYRPGYRKAYRDVIYWSIR